VTARRRFRTPTYPYVGALFSLFLTVVAYIAVRTSAARLALVLPIAVVGVALSGALIFRVYVRPHVDICCDGLTVCNPFGSLQVPWSSVQRIDVDRVLTITLVDGQVVRAWAVQAANITRLLHRESRADRVASELERWRARYAGGEPGAARAHS
jgi:hypothetical protein